MVVWLAAIVTVGVTFVATVMTTGALVAVGCVRHDALLVIITLTRSPVFRVDDVNVFPVAPVITAPFTDH
jgi:hypothetical protein